MSATIAIRKLTTTLMLTAILLLAGCGGTGDNQEPDPVVVDHPIAYVKRPLLVADENGELLDATDVDVRVTQVFKAGGDLYLRDRASPSAAERNITGGVTGGLGDVRDVSVAYDAAKLLFSLRLPEIPGADEEDQPTWNIWEYDIVNDDLHRVISGEITAEAGQDRFPHYLPGVEGRIVFSSTRQRQARARLVDEGKDGYAAMETAVDEAAMVLHVLEPATQEIKQISFNKSHDFAPVVLENGQIVFSRWDNFDGRNAISLYRINPDGTELRLLYGAYSHDTGTNGSEVQFIRPQELPDGELLVRLMPFDGTHQGGNLIRIDVANFVENIQPTWENAGLIGPAQIPATVLDVATDGTPSPDGRFRSVFPLRDGTERLLVSWSPCRLLENDVLVKCPADGVIDPQALEADPLYGIWIYDVKEGTQLPIVTPQEGIVYTDLVAIQARTMPTIIQDKVAGVELDPELVQGEVGVLHIRSVYEMDGIDAATDINGNPTTIPTLASSTGDQRPARFLRILKKVTIPDEDVLDFTNTAYGRTRAFGMREVVGYVPIEADGSVMVRVPSNVPLTFSVLDVNGRRTVQPHQYSLQFRPGEVVECNGCHDPASNLPHGRLEATPPPVVSGDSMAKLRCPNGCAPSLDLLDAEGVDARFSSLTTEAPVSNQACLTQWDGLCRSIIHYEQHIHPLWNEPRTAMLNGNLEDVTCTNCHTTTDAADVPMVPEGQLDLTDGASTDEPEHFRAYRELFFPDTQDTLDFDEEGNIIGVIELLVPVLDADGNQVYQVDEETGELILDAEGNPVPVPDVTVPAQGPSMRAGSANLGYFLSKFDTNDIHAGYLSDVEKKLISEWLDIGAQYYNNPFDAPLDN